MASAPHAFLVFLLGGISLLSKPCHAAVEMDGVRYFLASFPSQAKIAYMKEGHPILRDLIVGGHESLGPIAVDTNNARLYVADNAVATIYWYQLVALPDGRLTTDGRKNIAVITLVANSMKVDGQGNLFVGGQAITAVTPSAPAPPLAIHKFPWFALLTGDTKVYALSGIWNTANSGDPPKVFDPVTMLIDGGRIVWGNGKQGGTHGAVVEAPLGGGGPDAIKVHVDQGEEATGLCLSPEYIFYSTENGIFGIPRYKKEQGCGKPMDTEKKKLNPIALGVNGGSQTGPCRLISSSVVKAKGMVWDGDGTVFALDPDSGIYSFPSGNIEEHHLTKILDQAGLFDMDVLQISFSLMKASPSMIYMVMTLAAILLPK